MKTFRPLAIGFAFVLIVLLSMAAATVPTWYKGAFTRYSTNLWNFGPFTNSGNGSAAGSLTINDADDVTPIAGFDTNRSSGGWWGPGLAWTNNGTFIYPIGYPVSNAPATFGLHSGLSVGTNTLNIYRGADAFDAYSDINDDFGGNTFVEIGSGETNNVIAFVGIGAEYRSGQVQVTLDWNDTITHHFLEPNVDPLQGPSIVFQHSNQFSTVIGPFPTYGFSYAWDYRNNGSDQYHTVWSTNGPFSHIVASLTPQGVMSANGFIDNSGTPGQVVAYQGGGRLAATNPPLDLLAQSGAASGQVAEWNGSKWVPADVQGVTIPNTFTQTNIVANQLYTNTSGSLEIFRGAVRLVTAGVSGQSAFDVMVDQSGGNTFSLFARSAMNTIITSIAQNHTNDLTVALSNNAAWYTTNTSSGAGDSSALVPGTGQLIILSDGAAANVANASTTITINGTANHITSSAGAQSLAANRTWTLDVGSSVALVDANNAFTTASSNYWAIAPTYSTNLVWGPDFSKPESLISTNAAFTMVAPVGVDTTKKEAQWTLVNVTNTTAAAVLITAPANVHTVGTMYVTNWTAFWFQCYANAITNCYATPVF